VHGELADGVGAGVVDGAECAHHAGQFAVGPPPGVSGVPGVAVAVGVGEEFAHGAVGVDVVDLVEDGGADAGTFLREFAGHVREFGVGPVDGFDDAPRELGGVDHAHGRVGVGGVGAFLDVQVPADPAALPELLHRITCMSAAHSGAGTVRVSWSGRVLSRTAVVSPSRTATQVPMSYE